MPPCKKKKGWRPAKQKKVKPKWDEPEWDAAL
jgi:hypothetical protein